MDYVLHEAVNDFLAVLANGEAGQGVRSANTHLAYGNDLHQFCSYLVTQQIVAWPHVTSEHIAGYLQELCREHVYAERTIARKLCALRSFFRYMQRREALPCNPAAMLSLSPMEKVSPRVLSSAQLTSLFEQIRADTPTGLRDLAMCHIVYTSGMYASELVSLNVQHFDRLHLCMRCPGRSGERERTYPLSEESVRIFTLYLERSRPGLVRSAQEEALFLNHHGTRLTRQGFWLIMKGYARSIGCAELSAAMLRRSCVAAGAL